MLVEILQERVNEERVGRAVKLEHVGVEVLHPAFVVSVMLASMLMSSTVTGISESPSMEAVLLVMGFLLNIVEFGSVEV